MKRERFAAKADIFVESVVFTSIYAEQATRHTCCDKAMPPLYYCVVRQQEKSAIAPRYDSSTSPGAKLYAGVLGLGLLSCALLLSLMAWQSLRDRWERIEKEKADLGRMVEIVSKDTADMFSRSRFFLEMADYWLSEKPEADPRTDPGFIKLVEDFRESVGRQVDIRLVSESGGIYYLPTQSDKPLVDVSDRDYFKVQMSPATRGFYISSPVLSRVTGRWGIPISYPLSSRNAGIAVIFASIEMPVLEELYEKARPKPNGSIILLRGDGTILARSPMIESILGKPISNDIPAWRKAIEERPVWMIKSSADMEDRIIAAKIISNPDLVISVSAKQGDILDPWIAGLRWRILVSFLMVVAIAMISSRLLAVLKRLGAAQRELHSNMERLARSDATKDKLFSVIAHDLRGPIGGMASLLDTISMDRNDMSPEELGELIEALRSASRNTSQLLENLLAWSRSQRGELPFYLERVLVYPIAEECASLFGLNVSEKELSLELSIENGLEANADPEQLKTLLRNLLSNAVKYSQRGGRVEVSGSREEGGVLLVVRDQGIGMDRAQVEALYSPGLIRSRPGTANEHGSGLGFILCKEIVDLHGGRIEVESAIGKGSAFSVFLPD
jgi:signal transduction histidine kinase